MARVAAALDDAHGQHVVYRDVKPANIVVLPFGLPKIMDFGIANLDAGHHTTGQFLGTPLYMAPEQAQGQPVDGCTDVFSLASRDAPSRRRTCRACWPASLTWSPRRCQNSARVPEELGYLLARAMAKSPVDLPSSTDARRGH